jgi:hypothetical protein
MSRNQNPESREYKTHDDTDWAALHPASHAATIKKTSWLLLRKRTKPTDRPPLVGEF